jgi:hypothetical protein
MTRSQQPEDWKKQLIAAADDFDVKDQVLRKIKERQKLREGYSVKKRMGLIAAAILVFGGTSAFAAIQVYELKDEQGEAVVKIEQNATQPQANRGESGKILEDVRSSLIPGESAAVYIPGPENPDKIVSFTRVPVVHETPSTLQKEVGSFYKVPEELVGGYKFVEGHVDYLFDYTQPELFAEMHKEAERDKKEVVVRKVSPMQKIRKVYLAYTGSTGKERAGEVNINITNFEDVKYVSDKTGPDGIVETVNVKSEEALYMVKTVLSGNQRKSLKYYQADKKRLVEIASIDPNITKEEILAIAEKLE